jgi:hypothetical protein
VWQKGLARGLRLAGACYSAASELLIKPLKDFHNHPIYAGDLHRADMAWAKHAAGCGLTVEQIKDELLIGRHLSKKGSRKRQLEYAERTARKAVEQMQL